jgi:hypothetical protein
LGKGIEKIIPDKNTFNKVKDLKLDDFTGFFKKIS